LASCGAVDGFGPGDASEPLDLVEPVDAPVAELTVGVVEEVAPAALDQAVVGAQRAGAAPHVPVELCAGLGVVGCALGASAAAEGEAADHPDFADVTVGEELAGTDVVRPHAAVEADLTNFSGVAGGLPDGPAL